jgi:hypothetical protein
VSIAVHQWDVVRIRVRPEDRDEHPAVVMSREEWCQGVAEAAGRAFGPSLIFSAKRLARRATSLRCGGGPAPLDVTLNGADGLESMTLLNVEHVFSVPRDKITAVLGRVTPARRRQIGRTLVQAFRLPL